MPYGVHCLEGGIASFLIFDCVAALSSGWWKSVVRLRATLNLASFGWKIVRDYEFICFWAGRFSCIRGSEEQQKSIG
jgi:hypothetical protein